MNKLFIAAALGLPLLFVGCTCSVSTGGGNTSSSEWEDAEIEVSPKRSEVTSDNPGYFQSMTFYTLCIDEVNYLWEYYRDEMHVKYNKDGSISTCEGSSDNYSLSR